MFIRIGVLMLAVAVMDSALANLKMGAVEFDNGVNLVPMLSFRSFYDDNLLLQNTELTSTFATVMSAQLLAQLDDGVNRYQLTGELDKGDYASSSADNYFDQHISGEAILQLFEPASLLISGTYTAGHEHRGQGLTQGHALITEQPLTFHQQFMSSQFNYGDKQSTGRLVFNVKMLIHEYDSQQFMTRNYDMISYSTGFYYQSGAGGELSVELLKNDKVFAKDNSNNLLRDSVNYQLLTGVRWKLTGLSAGYIKVGWQKKDFLSEQRRDFGGLSWTAQLDYELRSYSRLIIETKRQARDPNLIGDYIKESVYMVKAEYSFIDDLKAVIKFDHTREKLTGDIYRQDQRNSSDFSLWYLLNHHMALNMSFGNVHQQSSDSQYRYQQNVFSINIKVGVN